MDPLVSILVPLYNVESYIEKCATSLFEQSYANCQYIFVNDATPDRSVETLQSTLANYPHRLDQTIIVTHPTNQGVATARNTALDTATGDYIIFVDSDDWVEHTLVEKLVDIATENRADITNAYCASVYRDGSFKSVKTPWLPTSTQHLKAVIAQSHIVQNHVRGMLIRRSLFEDYSLRFTPKVDFGEDYSLLPQLIYYANHLDSLTEYLYLYRVENDSSYMNNITPKHARSYLKANRIVFNFVKSLPDAEQFNDSLTLGRLNIMKWIVWRGFPLDDYTDQIAGIDDKIESPMLRLYLKSLNLRNRFAIKSMSIVVNLPLYIWVAIVKKY